MEDIDQDTLLQVVENMLKISSDEELEELCFLLGVDFSGPVYMTDGDGDVLPSTELERRQAALDQYADELLEVQTTPRSSGSVSGSHRYLEMSKFVPLRLEYEERKYLRLLESMMDSSEYTDRVDSIPIGIGGSSRHSSNPRIIAVMLKNICSVLSGLVIAHDPSDETATLILKDRDYARFKQFFSKIFEIGRRYKILNPERMRESYFKMMYFLQDLNKPKVRDLFEFSLVDENIQTVYSLLEGKGSDKVSSSQTEGGVASLPSSFSLVLDPLLETATTEILSHNKSKNRVQDEIRTKEAAIRKLVQRYSSNGRSIRRHRSSRLGGFSNYFFREEGMSSDNDNGPPPSSASLSTEEIERCIYSICDYQTFLRFNQAPCERMIELLKKYFSSSSPDNTSSNRNDAASDTVSNRTSLLNSLSITEGSDGARLTHSHNRQYTFVLQSLTLWSEVMTDMLKLWHAAEADLLDPNNPYIRTDTGQGLQRVQKAPRVYALMVDILQRVQRRLGGWIGSSTIHLGDENVPNALIFIDKYMQVPKILGPVALVIDQIETVSSAHNTSSNGLSDLVRMFGGVETLHRLILRDFFRHAFDGSGGDTFFEAGSCIDGRLTSAWNWCSKIETKEYFPIFQLTGFSGFDDHR